MSRKGLLLLEKSMTAVNMTRTSMTTARATFDSSSSSRRRCQATHAAKTAIKKPQVKREPERLAHRPASWNSQNSDPVSSG